MSDPARPASHPYDRPSDPAKRHSAALTDGPDRGQSIEFIRDANGTVRWVRVVGRVAVKGKLPND